MIIYDVLQNTAVAITFQIADRSGSVITTYDGTETLHTEVWEGNHDQVLFAPPTIFVNTPPTDGKVQIQITSAETASVDPGSYMMYTSLTAAGRDPVAILIAQVNIVATPDA
jgi:hypothetical protein